MSATTGKAAFGIAIVALIVAGFSVAQTFTLSGQISDISSKVSASSTKVDGLSGQVSTVAGKVNDLSSQVSELTAKVGPKTHNLTILLGEGEVISEVDGKDVLTGEFHRWEPDVMVVKKGDTVILNVKNPRKNIHSLVLPAFGVDTGELAGRTGAKTVQFTANKAGIFAYFCGVSFDEATGKCDPDHRRMVGYLIVLEG